MRRLDIWFLFCIALVLAIPTIGLASKSASLFATRAPEEEEVSTGEEMWGARADVFIATNYGMRKKMVGISRDIRNVLSGSSKRVVHGRDGWLFLTDNDVLSQTTGQRLDVEGLRRFVELAAGLAADARAKGRKFLVAIAPNKHTIYRDKLPQWARAEPVRTELDVLMDLLAGADIQAVDLRPNLMLHSHRPVYYRGDTHWSELGAAIAFDDIVDAFGYGREAIDLAEAFDPVSDIDRPGDLVKLAGLTGPWPEAVAAPRKGTFVAETALDREALNDNGAIHRLRHRETGAASQGPKVLVIGDSFTADLFGPLFMRFASEYVWMHNLGGSIDRDLIDRSDPDLVLLEVVERATPFVRFRPFHAASAGQ